MIRFQIFDEWSCDLRFSSYFRSSLTACLRAPYAARNHIFIFPMRYYQLQRFRAESSR